MRIGLREVAYGYHGKAVMDGFSAGIDTGPAWCLLGPSGIGKTTLFKTVLHLNPTLSGKVLVGNCDIHDFSYAKFARLVGYVLQSHVSPFSFKVLDVVAMGRTAHLSTFAMLGRDDFRITVGCLKHLGIAYLTERVYTELSDSERQLILIAEALAQQPRFIMMDEPISNLNFGNQARVLRVVKRLAEEGYGVVMTTHFPGHVFQYEALVPLMTKECRYLHRTASEALTPDNLTPAHGIRVAVFDTDYEGWQLHCVRPLDDPHPGP